GSPRASASINPCRIFHRRRGRYTCAAQVALEWAGAGKGLAKGLPAGLTGRLGGRRAKGNQRARGDGGWFGTCWQRGGERAHAPRRLWLFTTKAERGFWDVRFADGDGLVFGNEGAGAPEWLHEELGDTRVTIPQANPALRSLNLSAAAAVATFEALRQLRSS